MDSMTHEQLKEWVVENMFAIEHDKLSERKREVFMDFIKDRVGSPFIMECFAEFSKRKNGK
tara:strand:- start:124 stop:306 length:183 start_codon:yes stop_codon:yes gene_type:complete